MTDFTKVFRRESYATIAPNAVENDQTGRTVLVTGGSKGIGLGIASAFAEANASMVILVARSPETLQVASESIKRKSTGVEVRTLAYDISDAAQIQDLWSTLATDNVFVDVLVLNASTTRPPASVSEEIDMIKLNFIGHVLLFDHFKNQPNPGSRPKFVVNVSSASLHCYPYPAAMYAATKAGFGDYLCHKADFIPEDELRIVNLHPGSVYTSAAEQAGEVAKNLPIWDDLSLPSHTALWMTCRDAAFLHGRFVWANWDMDELLSQREKVLADPGYLKIGITGIGSMSVKQLVDICERNPLSKGSR